MATSIEDEIFERSEFLMGSSSGPSQGKLRYVPYDSGGQSSPSLTFPHAADNPESAENLMDLSTEPPESIRSRGHQNGRFAIMVPQTELKPDQRLRLVNPRSVKWLLNEVYPAYRRTSIDSSLNLIDFLSPEVTKQLITRAKRKWRSHYWHLQTS